MQARWWRGERPTTIRARVQLLVVACIVPAWLLAFSISYLSYQREREALISSTVQTASSLTQSVERELATSIAVLQTLATSTRIDTGDLSGFHARAKQTLSYIGGDNILLLDTELRGLVTLSVPFGQPLATLKHDRFPQVMATGQPAVSDFFIGQVSKQPQVAVAVPVMRDGKAIGRLEMVFSPRRFAKVLERSKLDPSWTAAVLDSQGVIVARNRNAESFVGKPASPTLLQAMQRTAEGSALSVTQDGIRVVGCFSRSAAYGWSVAIGVPEAALDAQLKRTLFVYGAGALALMLLGLLLARLIGRRIAEPIQALVAPALAIGMGESASIAPSPVREVAELGQALDRAQVLLREREQARQQAEALLRDSQWRLRMALDASQIGDWDLDLRTNEMHHSLQHDLCFGYTEPVADWSVARFFEHLHPDDRERVDTHMQGVLQAGGAWQMDCRIVWPDGSVHWLSTHGTCLTENGVPYFMLGILLDITDRKQSEELRFNSVRLEIENRQIQEANRLKSEFLANMSHELRTPLKAVIGFSDILRSAGVSLSAEKRSEYLGYIATSGRHLLQLINDVLDLSKVESGKFEFFSEPVDLPRLMREVTGVLQAEVARKGLTLVTELDPALTELVLDPARLKQMLYNFLSNAIKFTESGGRVVLRALAQGPAHLRIEVEDNGIGIAEADQLKLFHQFQQVQTGYAKPHQGTGLGLALTRRLAELQGGSVGVRSTPGLGSVFHLVLPCRSGTGATHVPVASAPAPPGARKVLVIEDDGADQRKLVQTLSAAGYHVDVAATGDQALERAASQRYDAITLDLLLPDRSGLEVLSTLRGGGDNRNVPVVVVTLVTETSVLAGFQISDVLIKPIRSGDVVAALRRACRNDAPLTVLVVDDDASARDLMAATLQSAGMTVRSARDGRSALASLDEQQPDAMVLDLLMPDMNGFDVLQALRERPQLARLPVFVWTSMELSSDELTALARSAQAIVGKGQGGIEALLAQIRAWHAVQPNSPGAT